MNTEMGITYDVEDDFIINGSQWMVTLPPTFDGPQSQTFSYSTTTRKRRGWGSPDQKSKQITINPEIQIDEEPQEPSENVW